MGQIIKNKRGIEAEVLSEKKIINEQGRAETWFDIMLVEKKRIISIKKIQMTKGSWTTRQVSKEKKEENKKRKKEKARNIELMLPLSDKFGGTLIALDQSTNGTGYSILDFSEKIEVIKYGLIKEKEDDFIRRTIKIIEKLKADIRKYNVKVIAIEAIYLDTSGFKTMIASRAKTYEILSYLKNRIIEMAIKENIQVIVVPLTWKLSYGIKGPREEQKKKSVNEIEKITGKKLVDDITDSLLIGKYVINNRISFEKEVV